MKLTANPAWLSLPPNGGKGSGAKFLRIMKLTTIIILAACLHTSAKGVAQQTITFSGKEVNLENVFNAIKKQTNYRFFFNTDMLQNASKVTLEVKNAQIEQVMNMALKDQPLTFTIKGRTIFIMKKPEEEKKSVQVAPTGDPITVSGRVTDENGEPLVGANVKVKGSSNGITTDNQGRFSLNNVDPNSTLEISFVGHETQLLDVKGKTVFSVALGQRIGMLDETLVIAYGTTSRRLATGNISSVKAKDIERQPVNNPLLALQGRVPGLFITQAKGLPGSGVTVRIQGQNSISNGNDPLYVIDGVPFISQLLPTSAASVQGGSGAGSAGGGSGNPLNYINPMDIESIEILKDADATAIYGSRAANGAILITTKRGKVGKMQADINIQQGWGRIANKLDLLNTEQYLEMRHEAKRNDRASINATDNDINGTWDTTRYTDWQKALIGGTAKYTNVNSNISGGSSNMQYLVGATYRRESTVFPGDFDDKKGSVHFNLNSTSPSKKLGFQLSGNYLVDNNQLPANDLTNLSVQLAPNAPAIYNPDGSLNWAINANGSSTWKNPLALLYNVYENKTSNLIANTTLSYQIVKGLELKSSLGYTKMESNEYSLVPLKYNAPEVRPFVSRIAIHSTSKINTWIVEPQLSYDLVIGKSKILAFIGSTINQQNGNGNLLNAEGFSDDALMKDLASASKITVYNSLSYTYKYSAIFGRLNYNFLDRYILNITARRDGSSSFGEENRFHNFGSFGFAWIFSNEEFVKKSIRFLSFGKLRGSYGVTGNDQIGNYKFMNLYQPILAGEPYQGSIGLEVKGLNNPYLQWEETRKLFFGIELGFINNRVLFNGTYSRNRSSNQLLEYALPIITGNSGISANFPAKVENTSLEMVLTTQNLTRKNFEWNTSINFTIPRNKLIAFPNLDISSYASTLVIGQPVSIYKAFHFLGVDPATGVYRFADKDGNQTATPDYLLDNSVMINTNPNFYGGIDNKFRIGKFQLDFLFQFVKQNARTYSLFGFGGFPPGRRTLNQPVVVLNRWQKPGDITSIQRYSSNLSISTPFSNLTGSDAVFSDASYIRLKNLSFSYTIFDNKAGNYIKNLRVYLQCQNLITITKFKDLDPESQAFNLPPLRMITTGVQFGL